MTIPSSIAETPVTFRSGGSLLFGMLYRPAAGGTGNGVVVCPPLFEERKASHGVLVDLARELAANGHSVLRFDYRGCGDSEGALVDADVSDRVADIGAAADFLRAHGRCERLAFLGLRVGAALCLRAALAPPDAASIDALMLWAPVLDGHAYVNAELRKKLVKEMVTFGRRRSTRAAIIAGLEQGRTADFDGYPLSASLYHALTGLDPLDGDVPAVPTLLVQIGPRAAARPEIETLAAQLGERGGRVTTHIEHAQPFWNLIGRVACPQLVAATVAWLGDTLGPGAPANGLNRTREDG